MHHIELEGSGVSIQGSYHSINQDSFLVLSYGDGWVCVVSDGMGTKKSSHYGSNQICKSIYKVLKQKKCSLEELDLNEFFRLAHKDWKACLYKQGYNIEDCICTVLVCIVEGNCYKLARLGDGVISVYTDKGVRSIFDDKSGYYLNETVGLSEILPIGEIEIIEEGFQDFYGVILCTDGIEIAPLLKDTIESFTKELIWESVAETQDSFLSNVTFWVKNWPGIDDKTLVYMINKEYIYE